MADDRQLTREDAARAQGATAVIAQAQETTLDTLRRLAGDMADREAQSAETSSRFRFRLITGILLAALVVVGMWLGTRGP